MATSRPQFELPDDVIREILNRLGLRDRLNFLQTSAIFRDLKAEFQGSIWNDLSPAIQPFYLSYLRGFLEANISYKTPTLQLPQDWLEKLENIAQHPSATIELRMLALTVVVCEKARLQENDALALYRLVLLGQGSGAKVLLDICLTRVAIVNGYKKSVDEVLEALIGDLQGSKFNEAASNCVGLGPYLNAQQRIKLVTALMSCPMNTHDGDVICALAALSSYLQSEQRQAVVSNITSRLPRGSDTDILLSLVEMAENGSLPRGLPVLKLLSPLFRELGLIGDERLTSTSSLWKCINACHQPDYLLNLLTIIPEFDEKEALINLLSKFPEAQQQSAIFELLHPFYFYSHHSAIASIAIKTLIALSPQLSRDQCIDITPHVVTLLFREDSNFELVFSIAGAMKPAVDFLSVVEKRLLLEDCLYLADDDPKKIIGTILLACMGNELNVEQAHAELLSLTRYLLERYDDEERIIFQSLLTFSPHIPRETKNILSDVLLRLLSGSVTKFPTIYTCDAIIKTCITIFYHDSDVINAVLGHFVLRPSTRLLQQCALIPSPSSLPSLSEAPTLYRVSIEAVEDTNASHAENPKLKVSAQKKG